MRNRVTSQSPLHWTMSALAAALVLTGCALRPPQPAPAQAPAPARPALMSWRVASAYLEDIFAQIPNSSIEDFRKETPSAERDLVNASHGEAGIKEGNAYVYGEPTPVTSSLMLERLGVSADDVLYDLGSGRGFFLMQALLTTPLKKAVGVELSPSRVAIGKAAQGLLEEQGLLAAKTLVQIEQDMTLSNLDDATLVYMDSVFYSDELLTTVVRKLSRAKGMRKVVMIQKGLPANPWFELERTEKFKMSWSPRFGTDVLFYKRTAAPAWEPPAR